MKFKWIVFLLQGFATASVVACIRNMLEVNLERMRKSWSVTLNSIRYTVRVLYCLPTSKKICTPCGVLNSTLVEPNLSCNYFSQQVSQTCQSSLPSVAAEEFSKHFLTPQECGHNTAEDAELFSCLPLPVEEAREQAQKVMLVHDDRLIDHQEGKRAPHPERPDRISAVIARLMKTGLAGVQRFKSTKLNLCLSQAFLVSLTRRIKTLPWGVCCAWERKICLQRYLNFWEMF